eukprot:COSAG01_NODE_512_length_16051_cov_33.887161_14_plen_258_part_00
MATHPPPLVQAPQDDMQRATRSRRLGGDAQQRRRERWRAAVAAAGELDALSAEEYALLARHGRAPSAADEKSIWKDVPRSRVGGGSEAAVGPEEESYLLSEPEQQALGRMLRVYATVDPEVGYCQGMNFVGAVCLYVLGGAEDEGEGGSESGPRPGPDGRPVGPSGEHAAWQLLHAMLRPEGLGLRALYLEGFHVPLTAVRAARAPSGPGSSTISRRLRYTCHISTGHAIAQSHQRAQCTQPLPGLHVSCVTTTPDR